MKVLEGAANTVGFSLTVLSACCWLVYVVGFALEYQGLSNEPSVNSTTPTNAALTLPYLSHWLYAITSVPLYIAALTVFLFGRRVFSSFSLALLTPLVCVCLGGMLQTNVLVYYHYYLLEDILTPPPLSVHVQTAGGLSALCLLWAVMGLWSCGLHQQRPVTDYQEIN